PLQTQSVTYIIQRTEALFGLFFLATLYCVIRGALSPRAVSRWHAAAIILCLLGAATKEVMAAAPVVILLYGRVFLSASFREIFARRGTLYLGLIMSWAVVAWLLIGSGFRGDTVGFKVQTFTPGSYLLTQSGVLLHYLRLAFWPSGLCLDYGWPKA